MVETSLVTMDFLTTNKELLDEKKPQTTYKIEYVSKYVEKWLCIMSNVDEVKNINFIDCMCNAGIYTDGGKGTAIKVLELFNGFALQHRDKTFNLILNDISPDRLRIITTIINDYVGVKAPNIHIVIRNMDVNAFLSDEEFFKKYFNCYPKRSSNLVFVDPYNFCTVKISVLEKFLSKTYCELIFNVFTSDFVRNQDKNKMKAALTSTPKGTPKIKSRISRQCDTYRRGGDIVAKITIIGGSLRINLPLDPDAPEFNDGKMPHTATGHKKVYAEVPFQFKVNSKLALKRALRLIELVK